MGFKDYLPFIGGGLDFGSNVFNAYNQNKTRDNYFDSIRGSREQEYQDALAKYEYDKSYAGQLEAAAAGNRAASAAAAGARRAAQMATDKNAKKAAKKAFQTQKKFIEQQMAMYQPYKQVSDQLLPQMQRTYEGGMQNLGMMSAYLNRPDQLQRMNQAASPASVQFKLPSYFQGGK